MESLREVSSNKNSFLGDGVLQEKCHQIRSASKEMASFKRSVIKYDQLLRRWRPSREVSSNKISFLGDGALQEKCHQIRSAS